MPVTASLNFVKGRTQAQQVTIGVSAASSIKISSDVNVNVIVDVEAVWWGG
jgi:hypothetical protein